MVLERLLRRDRRTVEEAIPLVRSIDPLLTRSDVETLARKIPERHERPRAIDVEDVSETAFVATNGADARALGNERNRLSNETSGIIRATLGRMTEEDRAILRFHYGASMTLADIARVLRLPQRPLYRRVERLHGILRIALQSAGIDESTIGDLIGASDNEMDFGWKNSTPLPSSEKGTKPAEERS